MVLILSRSGVIGYERSESDLNRDLGLRDASLFDDLGYDFMARSGLINLLCDLLRTPQRLLELMRLQRLGAERIGDTLAIAEEPLQFIEDCGLDLVGRQPPWL